MSRSEHREKAGGALLENLPRTVRRSRLRWLLRRSLTSLAVTAAGISTMAALTIGLIVLGVLPVEDIRWGVAGVAILSVAVAVILSWRATPDEAAMVRYIDDSAGLESQLVTAYGLQRDPPQNDVAKVLHLALVRDLERRAPTLRLDRLVPLRFLPIHAAAVAIVFGSVVAANVLEDWRAEGKPTSAAETVQPIPDWGEVERQELAAELELLAEVLDQEARQSGDEYTRALAEHARALARDLSQSDAITGAEISNLLSHVENALGARFAPSGSAGAVAEGGPALEDAALEGGPEIPVAGLPIPTSPAAEAALADVRAVRERLEMAQSQRIDNPYFGGAYQATPGSSPAEIQEAGLIGEIDGEAAGTPAGAAERSTDAAGDAAGGGSQDLDVGERAGLGEFGQGEDVALPEAAAGQGARVQASAEVGMEAEGGATVIGRNDGGNSDIQPGRGLAEAVVAKDSVRRDAGDWRRELLGPDARLVAQRLFEPEESETLE